MSSPLDLLKKSLSLFFGNFIYILKFWLVQYGLIFVTALILGAVIAIFAATKSPFTAIPIVIAVVIYIFLLYWLVSSSLVLYQSIADESRMPIKSILSRGYKIFGPVLGASLLSGLAVIGGLILLIIPGLIFMVWFSFSSQVVLYENLSWTRALSRSHDLVRGRFWPVVGYLLFPVAVVILLSVMDGALSGAFKGSSLSLLLSLLSALVNVIFSIVISLYQFLLYKQLASSK